MTLQIVCQDAQRSRGAGDLLQGVAQFLLGGRVLTDEGRISVFEHAVDNAERAPQIIQGCLQAGRNLAVDAVHRLARILQCLVEGDQRFSQIVANRFEWQFVKLVDDVGELGLDVRNGARDHRQLHWIPAPVDFALGASGKVSKAT